MNELEYRIMVLYCIFGGIMIILNIIAGVILWRRKHKEN